jgi:hypothetical protein
MGDVDDGGPWVNLQDHPLHDRYVGVVSAEICQECDNRHVEKVTRLKQLFLDLESQVVIGSLGRFSAGGSPGNQSRF